MMDGGADSDPVLARIREMCNEEAFRDELIGFLDDLCILDTTPFPEPGVMRKHEGLVFELISDFLSDCASIPVACDERAIPPSIAALPAFSQTHYLCTPEHPEGFTPEEAYALRTNLLVAVDGKPAKGAADVAVHAHVDTPAPFFSPRLRGDRYHGRGAADGKGNIAALCGAIKLIDRLVEERLVQIRNRISAMFSIDAETGGNGGLALARDRQLKRRFDSLLVLAGTGGRICCAGQGELWFRCEASWSSPAGVAGDGSAALVCAVAAAVRELQREGAAIREESDHALFPGLPAAAWFGVLGPFGTGPASACAEVALEIAGVSADAVEGLRLVVQAAVERHAARHAAGATPAGDFGFETLADGTTVVVTLRGSPAPERDDVIAKWASVVGEIDSWRHRGGFPWSLRLHGHDATGALALEGGQRFLPSHELAAVEQRLGQAFERGAAQWLAGAGLPVDSVVCATSFARRHREAFACDPESASVQAARGAAADAGLAPADAPVLGWEGPSDARLFARENPALPVIIAGVGERGPTREDAESIALDDVVKGVMFCALFLLRETGALAGRLPKPARKRRTRAD